MIYESIRCVDCGDIIRGDDSPNYKKGKPYCDYCIENVIEMPHDSLCGCSRCDFEFERS